MQLVNEEQWLVSCDSEALAGGANLAVLGRELIQFGVASPLGGGRFRLSQILRGRAGSEWAMSDHAAGDAFLLVDPETVRAVAVPAWAEGSEIRATARNLSGVESRATAAVTGESLRPLAPVSLNAELRENGDLSLSWVRRSRVAFGLPDGAVPPLGEAQERYQVEVTASGGTLQFTAGSPLLVITAADLEAIGGGTIVVEVRQVGDFGISRAASCAITA